MTHHEFAQVDHGSGAFPIIYADPPWRLKNWSMEEEARPGERWARRRGPAPYPCLNTEQIAVLPVHSIAAADCVLFLWATYPMLSAALAVIAAWGFVYKTVAFTWVKLNPSGHGFHFGMGYWTRANPEICLLATRGRPKRLSRSVPNLIVSPRREHSSKPDEVRDRIVALCGDVPRIELFARKRTPGWSVWGNEVDSDISLIRSNSP
jgi:N6-adenosine-specific RNA methylase IME4